jgi:hypothetical protein
MARVDHLSYSAIITFLRNQVEFQKRYIAKVFDNAKSPAMVVGTAFHKAMETYYSEDGGNINDAVAAGLEAINDTSDYEIDYGKTGSREKMIEEYTATVNVWFEEARPMDVLATEKRMEHAVNGVPMVGVSDIIAAGSSDNTIKVKDFKTVFAYSSPTNDPLDPEYVENYKYLLQGYIYLVLAEADYDKQVESVEFLEVKKSKNRDGSPQVRGFEYDRQSLLEFAPVAQKIITNVFSYVNDDNAKFFPNPSDYINGIESMQLVSNMEEGFDATKIRRKVNAVEKFAPRNVTIDVGEDDGTPEELILRKFTEFGYGGIMGETYKGASVIRYTMRPNRGVAMNAIAKKHDDIAIALKAESVRIIAPIPGTNLVGIEVPNPERRKIDLEERHLKPGTMSIPIGEDIFGEVHYGDITEMPHLLVAGQTGSGKSVMLNVILQVLTKQLDSDKLKLLLIDPKQVEFAGYESDKHLLRPVVTEAETAAYALDDLVATMNARYAKLRDAGVRKVDDYKGDDMPRIVAIIDEFADLIMTDTSPSIKTLDIKAFNQKLTELLGDSKTGTLTVKITKEALRRTIEDTMPPSCEESIVRLAQKARAVGIHLIIATQRPSREVITGLIKANFPTKIAFSVTNSMNSRIILDEDGAEQLTGYGDMLYQNPRSKSLGRLQGLYC